ncbi:MAG TPA: hypothetical protein VIL09_06495 [Microvirga sp.]|jgi:CYTH domain-containing protein
MTLTRRFLIAPSLARLLRRERGGNRVTEGHFPNQAGRSSHVHLDGETSSLVLVTVSADGVPTEERTDVPRAHAEALLDVAPGKVDYARTRLSGGGREIWVDRFVTPGPLDLISVLFETIEDAARFNPLPWFGPEVTADAAYETRSIALQTLPDVPDVPLSNLALDSMLDLLENRLGGSRPYATAQQRRPESGDALRRLSSTFGAAPARPAQAANPATAQPAAPAAAPPVADPAPAAAAPAPGAPQAPAPATDTELDVEDEVIRELARSLRPRSGIGG